MWRCTSRVLSRGTCGRRWVPSRTTSWSTTGEKSCCFEVLPASVGSENTTVGENDAMRTHSRCHSQRILHIKLLKRRFQIFRTGWFFKMLKLFIMVQLLGLVGFTEVQKLSDLAWRRQPMLVLKTRLYMDRLYVHI